MVGFGICLGRHQKQNHLPEDQISDEPPEIKSTPLETGELEIPDEPQTRKELIKDIVKHLENKDVGKVVLHGIQGVGKTWIAREVAKHVAINNIFDVTIWVYLHTNFEDTYHELYNNIKQQLFLQQADLSDAEYFVDRREDKKESVSDSIERKLFRQRYLLILDGENKNVDTEKLKDVLSKILYSANREESKVLVTKSSKDDAMALYEHRDDRRWVPVEVKPLTLSESKDLLKRCWKDDQIDQHLSEADVEEIVQGCNYLPASIVFMGNVLRYNLENKCDDLNKNLAVLWAKKGIIGCFMLAYEKFTNDSTLFRCFCRLYFYLEAHGFINYNELIKLLMLEGYFENAASFEKAYANAHEVLTDLLDAGLLGEREVGDIVLESTANDFVQKSSRIISRSVQPQFCFNYYKLESGGNIIKRTKNSLVEIHTSDDGTFKYVFLITLIVKGRHTTSTSRLEQLSLKVQRYTSDSLQILSFSNVHPIIELKELNNLRVLIIRSIHPVPELMMAIKNIKCLRKLRGLELSEVASLEVIEQELLMRIFSLEHVNLSGTGIKSIPTLSKENWHTFMYEADVKLRTLILRRCTQLESILDLRGFTELEVLDLSDSKLISINLQSLKEFHKLKVLNLSGNSLHELPAGVMQLKRLTHLLMKNCSQLKQIWPLNKLTRLQVIDAYGCTSLYQFTEENLPCGDSLKKLDLSYTMIQYSPPLKNAGNLVELCFEGCSQLKALPSIEGAKKLRVIDVSNAVNMEEINASFTDMESLQELLLSNTRIKTLPPISSLKSLQKLDVRGCEALQTQLDVDMLTNLILLDV